MTREEAILHIERIKLFLTSPKICWSKDDNKIVALDMAIEALKILGDDGIVNCCGCIHWKTDGGAMMMCELWDTPMGDFDYCSYGKREKPTIPMFTESEEAYKAWTGEKMGKDIKAKQKEVGAVADGIVGHETIQKKVEKAKKKFSRPHGEWLVYESKNTIPLMYKCSNCQKRNDEMSNYCPNCGSDMRGEEE